MCRRERQERGKGEGVRECVDGEKLTKGWFLGVRQPSRVTTAFYVGFAYLFMNPASNTSLTCRFNIPKELMIHDEPQDVVLYWQLRSRIARFI